MTATVICRAYGAQQRTEARFSDAYGVQFDAATTLGDQAFRACLAAFAIQKEVDTTLQLRIGLNSGQVIAAEIGSGKAGYTGTDQQVGMARLAADIGFEGHLACAEAMP
ncbi:MAG: hypothetical protein K2X52_19155 [Mycobacteriaceae bacterium]|nr:hypothetical protein [Mycobacteriaceae bacterium]